MRSASIHGFTHSAHLALSSVFLLISGHVVLPLRLTLFVGTKVEKRRGYLVQHGVDTGEQLVQLRQDTQAEMDGLIEQIERVQIAVAEAEQQQEVKQPEWQRLESGGIPSAHRPLCPAALCTSGSH